MRHQYWARLIGLATLVLWTKSADATTPPHPPTFYIGESTDFTGNGCENTDLNTVTRTLASELRNQSWTGSRFVNAGTFPDDFDDTGLTWSEFADRSTLAVYAGHGNIGSLQWGFMRNGLCNRTFQSDTRLGHLTDGQAQFGMYLTSCTLDNDANQFYNFQDRVLQKFGYHNSPTIADNQPRDFFKATRGRSNRNAWLDEMNDRPGWFNDDNSPRIVSFIDQAQSPSVLGCWLRHNILRLRASSTYVAETMADTGAFWWCATTRDEQDDC